MSGRATAVKEASCERGFYTLQEDRSHTYGQGKKEKEGGAHFSLSLLSLSKYEIRRNFL